MMNDEQAAHDMVEEPATMEYFTKSDVVTTALRELVITGELAPGTELRQRDLAIRFNVSPTPVREALRRLESEGLIDYDVHRGARVIDTAFEAEEENFLIRASLEGLAAALAAARATPEDLVALEDLNDQLSKCSDRDPLASELNRQFHFRLFEVARSPLLMALLRLLWHSFPQGNHIVRPLQDSVDQHREIIEALRLRDPQRAEDDVRTHILNSGVLKDGGALDRLSGSSVRALVPTSNGDPASAASGEPAPEKSTGKGSSRRPAKSKATASAAGRKAPSKRERSTAGAGN